MENRKIAIVTKRYSVARFFELEARTCGFEADIMTALTEDISDYSVVISDRNDKKAADTLEGEIFVTVRKGDLLTEEIWTLPVYVGRVRELFGVGTLDASRERSWEHDRPSIHISNEATREIFYKNTCIRLTEGEWKILLCLGENAGSTVSREKLTELLGRSEGNIADVYVCTLRRKLEAPFGIKVIKTVRGKGYTLLAKLKIDFEK